MLSDKQILDELTTGNVIIDPFDANCLGTNSYDCHLGPYYFKGDIDIGEVHLSNHEQAREYWGRVHLCQWVDPRNKENQMPEIIIHPGTTILTHTEEFIGGRNGYVAKMYSRSTIARSGLSVCRCAGVGDVGYTGRWTMEISNHTQTTLYVPVGFPICQFTFEYVGETLKEYPGKYGKNRKDWTPYDMLPQFKETT